MRPKHFSCSKICPCTCRKRRIGSENGLKQPQQTMVSANVEAIHEYLEKQRRMKRYNMVIDPRKSTFMSFWDVLMIFALLCLSLVTPYEVAFLPSNDEWDVLFWFNRGIDFVFLMDMGLSFFVMFMVEDANGVRWIDSQREIIKAYLMGWFCFVRL